MAARGDATGRHVVASGVASSRGAARAGCGRGVAGRAGAAALLGAAAWLALGGGGAAWAGGGGGPGPSPLIFPPQQLPLRFDHAAHLKLGLACVECHDAAAASTAAVDVLVPVEGACVGCHAIDRTRPQKNVEPGKGPARCDACHPGWAGAGEPPRVAVPAPSIKFNHRLHAGRGIECVRCHGEVAGKALATRADLPRMALCLECHDGGRAPLHAPGRCATCHLVRSDGRLVTDLPGGKLEPSGALHGVDAHTPSFRSNHKQAGRDEAYCLTCHKKTECSDCHGAGVVRPFSIHPGDYVTLHGIDARRNTPDCSSCHRLQTFCVACHQRLGVAADPESGVPGQRPNNPFGTGTQLKSFHPQGWVRDAAGAVLTGDVGPHHHSFQAKRNIRACASCHREETCLECHSSDPTRTANISPHGPGFASTARCRALASRNRRACLKCHDHGAAELDCR